MPEREAAGINSECQISEEAMENEKTVSQVTLFSEYRLRKEKKKKREKAPILQKQQEQQQKRTYMTT